jgi:putative transposase
MNKNNAISPPFSNPDLRSGRHCVFLLHLHLVFTTKYRKKIFTATHFEAMQNLFGKICTDFGANLRECDGEQDHVHLLIDYPPTMQISKLVNSLKGVSSRKLRQEYPELASYYWKNSLWSRSYFAGSVGGAPLSLLKEYIQNQRK